jgi:hypothetical protein
MQAVIFQLHSAMHACMHRCAGMDDPGKRPVLVVQPTWTGLTQSTGIQTMPKATETPTTPSRPDHDLMVLGEALTALNHRLGAEDLTEIERAELTEEWYRVLDAMCGVEAKTPAARRIKAVAIITAFARTGDVHKVALSLAGDILAARGGA